MKAQLTKRFSSSALAMLVVAVAVSSVANAANPISNDAFTTINVDGSTLFSGGQSVSVVQDGGTFNMFYRTGPNAGSIGEMNLATSTDGVNFTNVGPLSFASDPFTGGTAPYLYYDNVSVVGGNYKIQHWTYNGGEGTFPNYRYNISISDAGVTPSTTVTHQGPIGTFGDGFAGNVGGVFGIVNGNIYTYPGARTLTRAAYTDGTPPSASSQTQVADFQPLFDSLAISNGYINNHSDVIDLSGGAGTDLGFYFTVRDNAGVRQNEQVYFSESVDGGATWSVASPTFTSPTLDGGAFGGNFAHADVIDLPGGGYGMYIGSQDANGDYIIATNASAIPEPTTFALAGLGLCGLATLRRRRQA